MGEYLLQLLAILLSLCNRSIAEYADISSIRKKALACGKLAAEVQVSISVWHSFIQLLMEGKNNRLMICENYKAVSLKHVSKIFKRLMLSVEGALVGGCRVKLL